jgi:hypothetical protein
MIFVVAWCLGAISYVTPAWQHNSFLTISLPFVFILGYLLHELAHCVLFNTNIITFLRASPWIKP